VKFSVRGKTGNAARKFAEKYGGGGHNLSSGFIMPLPQFCKMIEKNGKKYSTSRRRKS
jgi:nanoRNase/pAp phosphatase (c-di-AMP/oligoRNAs hydrolase)